MRDSDFQNVPRSRLGGVTFIIGILAAPIIANILCGGICMFGILALGISFAVFNVVRLKRSLTCEICGRPLINLRGGSQYAESLNIGTFMSTEGMKRGDEGPGDECQRCGRIYCTNCAQIDMICVCGSESFRTVRLRYRY
jgi:hypothetical protein